MTNYEKIKSEMTVEEAAKVMAFWFNDCDGCPLEASGCDYNKLCRENLKEWLEREAETG